MPPSSSTTPPALSASLSTLASLTAHCRASLQNPNYTAAPPLTSDPLELLHTTATLAKAHITRLSVSLCPPITDGAAQKFLGELSASIVPTLAAAVASCNPAVHGRALAAEVVRAVDALLSAIGEYVSGVESGADTGRLRNTGVVWSAADKVMALKTLGLCGVVETALKTQCEMVEDARTELKEWVENEDEDGSEAEEDGQDFWDRPMRKGRLDEATKKCAEEALRKLKLVTILFGAARKRRLVGEGKLGTSVERADGIARVGEEISKVADDLGIAFYEDEDLGDAEQARSNLVAKAVELAELCVLNDKGEKDSYSTWFENCKAALQKST